MEALTNFFFDKNCHKILDVGTGTGDFIYVLNKAFPQGEIVGIDPLNESLDEARTNFPEINFFQGNAEKLPFEAGSFDVASISLALHHLSKVSKGLREMKRVVKKNGWVIINEIISDNLNPAQEVQKMFHHFKSKIDRISGINHNETFTKEQVIQMVESAGISIQFIQEYKDEPLSMNEQEVDLKVKSMEKMLAKIQRNPEYDEMKGLVPVFRERALLHGFQHATKVVIVGRKIK